MTAVDCKFDVSIMTHGCMAMLVPANKRAEHWLLDNVVGTWHGQTLLVLAVVLPSIIDAMVLSNISIGTED